MKEYRLCAYCNSANTNSFEQSDEECYVCSHGLDKIDQMANKGVNHLLSVLNNGVRSFSISTFLPKKWQINEEDLWDLKISGAESIKNYVNRYLRNKLTEESRLEYSPSGDIKLLFNLRTGEVAIEYLPLYVFGRYKKLVKGLSQTRWPCRYCRGRGCKKCGGKGKLYHSVEEEIGEVFKKHAKASSYTMHASGREDVDATNSGGRPFVLELRNTRLRNLDLDKISNEIAKNRKVEVSDLKITKKQAVELVSESHFDKLYTALVKFNSPLTSEQIKKLNNIRNVLIHQKTPTRVLKRRADLIRRKLIYWVEVREYKENYATVKIFAEAGTYIKEFVSGDDGRTNPSLSSMLNNPGKVQELDVTKIDDRILEELI